MYVIDIKDIWRLDHPMIPKVSLTDVIVFIRPSLLHYPAEEIVFIRSWIKTLGQESLWNCFYIVIKLLELSYCQEIVFLLFLVVL